MKSIVTLFLFLFLFNCLCAQTKEIDTLYITQIYKDVSEFLISDTVIVVDSTSQAALLQRFENWGGETYRDYEKVRTSKTESQVTILYIYDESYFIIKAQFKDNKVKISIYDDGNTYKPAINSYDKATQARTYKLRHLFDVDNSSPNVIIYKTKEGYFNMKGKRAKSLLNYKRDVENTILSIAKSLNSTSDKAKSDDW
jgi:hypothetical protein